MRPSPKNRFLIAAAGSRKTQEVVEIALSSTDGAVLITTYTNENKRELIRRLTAVNGCVPRNVTVMSWFSFLIAECCRPYQRRLTGIPLAIRGLNFIGEVNRYIRKADIRRYYFDSGFDLYRDRVSDFVCALDAATGGAVIRRLERAFQHILIDELQDLVGYDLDLLERLLASNVRVTAVGDPRQHTLATNRASKNKKYQGAGLMTWLHERAEVCSIEARTESYRCNQQICDFADQIYPEMPATQSKVVERTGHDGVFNVRSAQVTEYYDKYRPTALRHDKGTDTLQLPAINIGVSKGRTFDRVLIFPTKPMLRYLRDKDPKRLAAPERLYVAVTRARYSVAFVVPD